MGYSLSEKDHFLVLATDGIFDVLSNQEVVDLALRHCHDAEEAAKNIVRTAYKKGSEDNLTVLVIQFGWADANAAKYKTALAGGARTMIDSDLGPGPGGSLAPAAVDDTDMFG